ncbi:MAG: hypothetical protein JJU32_04390 [Phormidium sp. BM_Day4_Bin.17]|nr:hypothetical protein [Phormidium sp. BM_Day4_Bin.17]UCJ12379.1 MAG: hypothetical protein JWS08_00655 [Phormidium sp. PBR-2020]
MRFTLILALSLLGSVWVMTPEAQAHEKNHRSALSVVNLARNGYLQDQAIPQFNRLGAAYRGGSLTAEDVIEAAVNEGRLSADRLTDESYRDAVADFLDDLDR